MTRPPKATTKREQEYLLHSLAGSRKPITLSPGPRTLWFLGVQYELTPYQFAVIKILVDKWGPRFVGLAESEFRGEPDTRSSTGYRTRDGYEALSNSSQVKSCFKKSPLWGYLLIRTEKRRLTLNLPYFGTSKSEIIQPPCPEALFLGKAVPQIFARKPTKPNRRARK